MSSRPIERFVQQMLNKKGDELIFQSDRPIRYKAGGEKHTLINQATRTDQIERLLADIVPPDIAHRIATDPSTDFRTDLCGTPAVVRVRRKSEKMAVSIKFSSKSTDQLRRLSVPNEQSPRPMRPSEIGLVPVPAASQAPNLAAPAAQRVAGSGAASRGAAPARSLSMAPAPATDRLCVPTDGSNRIDPLLTALVESGGSDLHVTATMPPLMRKDGDMCPVPGWTEPLSSDVLESWLMEIAAPQFRQHFEDTMDSDYAHEIRGVGRFRVNAFVDRLGTGGVMRVIPSEILTADDLGLPPAIIAFTDIAKGLVLVTGPTGSGKSTTLAAMLDRINKTRSEHIITIEDPVEFVHPPQKCLVNQREVFSHTLSFKAALRAALREDPDIVLVGELRDLETIAIAIETAETGHLVFGTLHTNTAISTVDRIIDQFPSDREKQIRVMLSESLRGVVAQTLCKKIGGGRIAALEVLVGVPAVANLIREGKTFQIASIMQTGKSVGMQTLNDALVDLVKAKKVTPEEAYRRALAKNEMKQQLQRVGHPIPDAP